MLRKAVVTVGVVVGVLGFCCLSYGADLDKGLGFYLPFDRSLDAEVSGGVEVPKKESIVKYEKGVKGDGVIINGTALLDYKVKKGYFLFERGTISLWIKANFDNPAFRKKVDKDTKTQGWYFSQNFIDIGNYGKLKLELYLCQCEKDRFAANLVTQTQHYKNANFPLEKDKWVNCLYTWDTDDENLEFYINGKRTEGRILSHKDFWELPEEIDYSVCTIKISGAAIHAFASKKLSSVEKEEIFKEILPDNFTYTIDEVRIYDRVLTKEEIEELSSGTSPII